MQPRRNYHIQTRGYSQENDYRWFLIPSNGPRRPDAPVFLNSIEGLIDGLDIQDLIDFQRPSLVLARYGKFLFLLVTALEADSSRVDYMGRPIRNSVAWTFEVSAESSEDEKIIRAITISALKGELGSLISTSIWNDDSKDYGFQVSFEKLESVGKTFDNLESASPEPKRFIGGDSAQIRKELCDELSKNRLKDDEGLLILVTTLKSEEAMRNLPVWRGISSRFNSDGEWLDISHQLSNRSAQKKRTPILRICIIILLSLLIVLGIYLLWVKVVNPEKEVPKQEQEVNQTQVLSPPLSETTTKEIRK